ncbi:hypothetical protein, conserved [Babesia bigemina]|uniref:Diphthine methyltransferase n=1 Tax=Babesia bigemina TaxID=5866 RepID=A0A061CZC0_BABBI|nr:hypothetical protein, conserved [Babesia bigemina]CDR93971.1 hypothetical protein, conserved [Babesia bigemina]|eukprot:XP_012766157.1 hypothetical protein, conserved [Babesia bigemina]
MASNASVNVIHTLHTKGQPDCIKLFPSDILQDDTLTGTCLAATYDYRPETKSREGSLLAFNPWCAVHQYVPLAFEIRLNRLLQNDVKQDGSIAAYSVTEQRSHGILSCSWIKLPDHHGASCVTSNLTIETFKVEANNRNNDDSPMLSMERLGEIQLDNKNDVDGFMAQKWCGSLLKAHEVETWISTFQPDNSNVLLTGADDSQIKLFDRRIATEPLQTLKCFDRHLMRFDMRNMKSPISVWQTDGAVWYIDFVDWNKLHVAGCYDGALVYASEETGEAQPLSATSCELKKRFAPDNALIYGASHYELPSGNVYISCNFYEKQILFWQ